MLFPPSPLNLWQKEERVCEEFSCPRGLGNTFCIPTFELGSRKSVLLAALRLIKDGLISLSEALWRKYFSERGLLLALTVIDSRPFWLR